MRHDACGRPFHFRILLNLQRYERFRRPEGTLSLEVEVLQREEDFAVGQIVLRIQRTDRWDLSPQPPQWRQNPRSRITIPALNLALSFVASHKNGSLAQDSRRARAGSSETLERASKDPGPKSLRFYCPY